MQEGLVDKLALDWFKDDAKKVNAMVDQIMKRFPTVTDKDDFYSLAGEVFIDVASKWEPGKGDFKGLFFTAVRNKIMSEMTARSAQKRLQKDENGNAIAMVYLDEDVAEDVTVGDFIEDPYNLEDDVINTEMGGAEEYLNSLTRKERKTIQMIMDGYKPNEICKRLGMLPNVYEDTLKQLRSYSKVRLLGALKTENKAVTKTEDKKINEGSKVAMSDKRTVSNEKYIRDKITVGNLVEAMNDGTLNYDDAVQRADSQWNTRMKGELIYTVLSNDPISELYFAERDVDGEISIDNIDGKQRSTTVNEYMHDLFQIPKNITRFDVPYQHVCRDESGKIVRKENGMPVKENFVCDIRKKKFSDLPKELQDAFKRYTFGYVKYINCSDDDIAYYICKHNDGKQMNPSQKGMGNLGIHIAEKIKEISAMDFFVNYGSFTNAERRNGALQRVVVDTIMLIFFQNEWKKGFEEHCKFLSSNLTDEQIEETSDIFEHLGRIASIERQHTEKDGDCEDNLTGDYLTSKDTFLWAKTYSKYAGKVSDDDFAKFIVKFYETMTEKTWNGTTFEEINATGTKQRNNIIKKVDLISDFLKQYFEISEDSSPEAVQEDGIATSESEESIEEEEAAFIEAFKKDNYAENSFTFTDSELKKIYKSLFGNKAASQKEIDDLMFVVDCLSDYTVDLTTKLNAGMFAALVKTTEVAINREMDDKEYKAWLERFIASGQEPRLAMWDFNGRVTADVA